ncbi:unnamed protein product [Tetraodon nigroviridis]|uniref:(spotted green pufferfish) hypothetical protein n=1 Tax=Tetraodon nigroviridis TaxID=99883 RepID=Q4RKM3_TETNG|nr:unnamed protein product [Tetraodon nigroviridis]
MRTAPALLLCLLAAGCSPSPPAEMKSVLTTAASGSTPTGSREPWCAPTTPPTRGAPRLQSSWSLKGLVTSAWTPTCPGWRPC